MTAPFVCDLADTREYGVPIDGSADAAPRINELFEQLPAGSVITAPLSAVIRLDDTLVNSDRNQVSLIQPWSNPCLQEVQNPTLRYQGLSGGTMVSYDRARFCQLQGWEFQDHSEKGVDIVVSLDGYSPGHIGTMTEVVRCLFVNSKQNPNWRAISIAERNLQNNADPNRLYNAGNQEYHSIERCRVSGGGVGRGCVIAEFQAKSIKLTTTTFENLDVGVEGVAGVKGRDLNFTANNIDVHIFDAQDATKFVDSESENSRQHLVFCRDASKNYGSGAGSISIIGGRFGPQNTAPGKGYFEFNPASQTTLIGNTFDSRPPEGSTLYSNIPYRGLELIANYYSGDGMTLAQLGLKMGVGYWSSTKENILDLGANVHGRGPAAVHSAHADGGTGAWMNSLLVGDDQDATPVERMQRFAFTVTPAVVPARSSRAQTFPCKGIRPDDFLMHKAPTEPNAVHVAEAIAGLDSVTLLFVNASAKSATPAAGAYQLFAIRARAS